MQIKHPANVAEIKKLVDQSDLDMNYIGVFLRADQDTSYATEEKGGESAANDANLIATSDAQKFGPPGG